MKKFKPFVMILLLFPVYITAGNIFGTITKDGRPCAKQVVIITTNNGTETRSDTTDAYGYFSITIKQLGQCKLKAGGAEAVVYSNNSPTGYTFILTKKDSKWQLLQK